MQDYEKLGSFYLGRPFDLQQRSRKDEPLLYDSRDLVTHAVCVGMTGSGKTGLCIGLIEEAAIDGIPALVIDPKGDLTNLLLTFPALRGEDFLPWINPDDARTRGLSNEQYAEQQAGAWKTGLADWGQDGARIQKLRDAARFAIYTPRSTAGLPVSILQSFAAPPREILDDSELMRERVNAAASSLLALVGIEADPVRSREHILLSTILDRAWREGRASDLPSLINDIQKPPVTRFGALDLNAFYPEKDRFEFALTLNNILASPGFEAWLQGEPLEIGRMLHTAEGRPQVSVFSIAHLDDNERMFFVSLLLNQVVGWMRAQSGTSSLRAILYMDEIFGYFPPVSNPPSKTPLLTLLKQGRAFGLGTVLATQNPVDLDYKGLANAGTWFIGRLQTERDKARVLDGLEGAVTGAGKGFDRQDMDRILSALGQRVFLMNNVHEDAPVVFQTRWTLSYLRGPLSRDQVRSLMNPLKKAEPQAPPAVQPTATPVAAPVETAKPVLPPGVPEYYAPARGAAVYEAMLVGAAQVRFRDLKMKVDETREPVFLAPICDGPAPVNWDEAAEADFAVADLEQAPAPDARYAPLPPPAAAPRNYAAWNRDFAAWLCRTQRLTMRRSPSTTLISQPGESERDFRVRNQQAAREARDQAVEDLRRKYAPKTAVLEERLRRAQQAVQREREQAQAQNIQTAVSVGATLLGALLGRKAISSGTLGRATTAMRSATRARKESQDVQRSGETVEAIQAQINDLEAQIQAETAALQSSHDAMNEQLETVEIPLKRTNAAVRLVALAWIPKG